MTMTAAADDRLANLLAVLADGLTDDAAGALEHTTGLRGAAPTALLALREFLGGANIGRLAQALGLSHSGAVRLVNQLELAGLARRVAGPDRRQVSVALTAKGRRAAERAAAARSDVMRRASAGLARPARRELERLLERLVATLATERALRRSEAAADEPQAWLCRSCDFRVCGRPAGRCPAARAAASVFG